MELGVKVNKAESMKDNEKLFSRLTSMNDALKESAFLLI